MIDSRIERKILPSENNNCLPNAILHCLGRAAPRVSAQTLREMCREWLEEPFVDPCDCSETRMAIEKSHFFLLGRHLKNRDRIGNFQSLRVGSDFEEDLDMRDGHMMNVMCTSAFGLFLDVTIAVVNDNRIVSLTELTPSRRLIYLHLENLHFEPMGTRRTCLFTWNSFGWKSIVAFPSLYIGSVSLCVLAMSNGGLLLDDELKDHASRLEILVRDYMDGLKIDNKKFEDAVASIETCVWQMANT